MNNVHETIDGIRLGYIEFFNIYLPYKKAPLELELCDGLKTHVIECNYLSDGAEQQFSDIIEASISTAVDRFKQEIQEVQEMVYENEIHRFLKTKVMIELLNEKKGENMEVSDQEIEGFQNEISEIENSLMIIEWTDKRGLRLKMIELIIAIMKESNYLCLSDKIQELWVPYDHNSGLYNTFYRYRIGSAQYKLTIRGSQEDKLIIKSIQDYFSETELDFLIAAERQGTFYKVSLKWSETWEDIDDGLVIKTHKSWKITGGENTLLSKLLNDIILEHIKPSKSFSFDIERKQCFIY